jgi:hypothetical protein
MQENDYSTISAGIHKSKEDEFRKQLIFHLCDADPILCTIDSKYGEVDIFVYYILLHYLFIVNNTAKFQMTTTAFHFGL